MFLRARLAFVIRSFSIRFTRGSPVLGLSARMRIYLLVIALLAMMSVCCGSMGLLTAAAYNTELI